MSKKTKKETGKKKKTVEDQDVLCVVCACEGVREREERDLRTKMRCVI